jgi:hypothetical protein
VELYRRKRRHTTHLRDHPDYVTIIRERHAFEGQTLAVISSIKRRGPSLLVLLFGELDDESAVLGRERDKHDDTDLGLDVAWRSEEQVGKQHRERENVAVAQQDRPRATRNDRFRSSGHAAR